MSDWWNRHLPNRMAEFERWLTGPMDETRLPVRQLVRERGCKSFLDVGAGLAAEYDGFHRDGYDVQYCGVEPCAALRERASKAFEITMLDSSLPTLGGLGTKEWDAVHCRGVLEHLPTRADALCSIDNMVRCARVCVLISFAGYPVVAGHPNPWYSAARPNPLWGGRSR